MKYYSSLQPRQRVLLAILTLAIAGGGVLGLFGMPSWIVLLASPLPWVVIAGRYGGGAFAGGATITVSLWLILMTMMSSTASGVSMITIVVILWTVLGLIGVVVCVRNPAILRLPSLSSRAVWFGAPLGAIVWLGAMVLTNVIPHSARLSWVMLGDSANNVLFARNDIYSNGIVIGAGENPVPLPTALLAIVMGSGRSGVSSGALLEHDIAAFSQVWMILIALACLAAGLVAGTIARATKTRSVVVALVAGGGSLLPLSWFYTGYPVEYGFFNTHPTIIAVLSAFLIYVGSERRPAATLGLLCLSATVLFSIWGPLVLMPAFLALVVAIRYWRRILASRGIELVILSGGILQLLLYGLCIVLPSLLRNGQSLSAVGGAFGFRHWMLIALVVAALILVVAAFHRLTHPLVLGTLAISGGSLVGLGTLLFLNRNELNPWTYYPLKFEWFASTIVVVLIVGLAPAVVGRYFQSILAQLIGVSIVVGGTLGFLAWTPTASPGYRWANPIDRILSGDVLDRGDALAKQIFELADPQKARVLWQSGNPSESMINFWLLQMWSNSMNQNLDLKYAAYGLYSKDTGDLCNILGWMGGDVSVYTASATLPGEVQDECPSLGATTSFVAPLKSGD